MLNYDHFWSKIIEEQEICHRIGQPINMLTIPNPIIPALKIPKLSICVSEINMCSNLGNNSIQIFLID